MAEAQTIPVPGLLVTDKHGTRRAILKSRQMVAFLEEQNMVFDMNKKPGEKYKIVDMDYNAAVKLIETEGIKDPNHTADPSVSLIVDALKDSRSEVDMLKAAMARIQKENEELKAKK